MRNLIVRALLALCIALPALASEVSTWSTTSDNNNASPPNGWPEGMNYSQVNNSAREMMGAIARWRATFTASGATLSGTTTLSGNAAVGGTLGVTGVTTLGTANISTMNASTAATVPTVAAATNSTAAASTAWVRGYAPSGVYNPTTGPNSGVITAATPYGLYTRVGNIVHVQVRFGTTPTVAGTCNFQFTLPINSNIGAVSEVVGSGYSISSIGAVDPISVQGVVGNPGRVFVNWIASGTAAGHTNVSFSYEIH